MEWYLGGVKRTLTINPANMKRHRFDPASEPEWAELAEYLANVAPSGDVVHVSARPEGMSPNQVASRMGMSRTTVMRLISSGELRAYKVGAHWRVPLAAFDAYRHDLNARMLGAIADDIEAGLVEH